MTRSLTSILFRAARLSADGRAIRKGPAAVGKATEVAMTVEEFMGADFIIPSHGESMAPGFTGTAEDANQIIERLAK